MSQVLIIGNSGSGKSTLAKLIAAKMTLSHLDLDQVAWQQEQPTQRQTADESQQQLQLFITQHPNWVIEGCYADLARYLTPQCQLLIFLNPSIETCIQHCQSRPWESHKYPNKAAQDANLAMLIQWVRDYPQRDGDLGLCAHRHLFEKFGGKKVELNHTNTIKHWLDQLSPPHQ